MNFPVSKKISELKESVRNGNKKKVEEIIKQLAIIKLDALTEQIIQIILSKGDGGLSSPLNNSYEARELNDEHRFDFFKNKNLLNDFIKNKKTKKGVSFVTVSMNREQNLLRALPTWLETQVDEIIIVDWSSKENLAEKISTFNDPRISVVQINGEKSWILTHAFNLGLKLACREKIYKLDSDILVNKDFIADNHINTNEFIRGFWKFAIDAGDEGQKYVNGTFGAFNKNLQKIGYYDERITTYGWDDSDIYHRLVNLEGVVGKFLKYNTVFHQEQDQDDRIKHQDIKNKKKFLGVFDTTEIENSKNKFQSYFRDLWGPNHPQQDYELELIEGNLLIGHRITKIIPPLLEDLRYSEMFATREFLGWVHSDFHRMDFDALKSLPFAKLMNELIRDGNDIKFKEYLNSNKNIKLIFCEDLNLLEAACITLSKLFDGNNSNDFPIIIIVSRDHELAVDSPPGIYIINESLGDSISRCLFSDIKESNFYECVENLNSDVELVHLTYESIVKSCWVFKDVIQSSVGNFANKATGQQYKLVISLYDEKNLYRIRDYLVCLLINIKIFQFIEVYYEHTSGGLLFLLSKMLVNDRDQKVIFKFCNRRPTYSELFDGSLNKSNELILIVANADVFFDASISYISYSSIQNTVMAVSRRDILNQDGRFCSKLIKYENGSPNILSADAWIVPSNITLPKLDYQLGTIHCDSFFYNAILNRSELSIINPAIDLCVYHLHDERFNSSEEKKRRDIKEIKFKLQQEKAANGGMDPIAGVSWCSVQEYNRFKLDALQRWRPNTVVLVLKRDTHIMLILLTVYYLSEYLDKESDVMIVLNIADVPNKIAIERFLGYINKENIQIDIEYCSENQIDRSSFNDLFDLIYEKSSVTLINYLRHQFMGNGAGMTSVSFDFSSSELSQVMALKFFDQNRISKCIEVLDSYIEVIKDHSYEISYYLPYISDYKNMSNISRPLASGKPAISFITSMFNAGAYLPSFLENIFSAAVCSHGEVILIDVNNHDNDEKIVKKFLKENAVPTEIIRYVRLDKDPGLYKTWEYGINISNSEVISNANVDDKRSATHSKILLEFLNVHNQYSGACGSIWATSDGPYERYTSRLNGDIWFFDNPVDDIRFSDLWMNDEGLIKSRNIMHCIPVWRKKLHEKYGFFDEDLYGTSADWAFWLKCTKGGEVFKHLKNAFGKYYINPNSHNRINDSSGDKELRIIQELIGVEQKIAIKQ